MTMVVLKEWCCLTWVVCGNRARGASVGLKGGNTLRELWLAAEEACDSGAGRTERGASHPRNVTARSVLDQVPVQTSL